MGLFKRFKEVIGAKTSAILHELEKPDEQLDYMYEKLIDEKKKVDIAVRDAIAAKHTMEKDLQSAQKEAVNAHEKAKEYRSKAIALEAKLGELEGAKLEEAKAQVQKYNDVVRQLLSTEAHQNARAEDLKKSLENAKVRVRALEEKQIDLKTKIQRFKSKKDDLTVDWKMAKAEEKVNSALAGVGSEIGDIDITVSRMEERIKTKQAKAAAAAEMAGSTGVGIGTKEVDVSSIEKELKLEDDLAALDAELKK